MGIRCNSLWIYCVGFIQKRVGESVNSLDAVWIGFGGIWIISVDWLQCSLVAV